VQKEKISFIKLAFEDKKIAPYIKKFSKRELELVKNPEKYTGLAAKKAEKICRKWKKLLGRR
jgi:adenylosuccinate lyase